jgi:glycosyltransferase involved in cell wall biosynthesis
MKTPTPQRHLPPSTSLGTVLQVLPALKDGGVETSAIEMALYLKSRGYRSLVASEGGERVSGLVQNGVQHITLPLATKLPWGILWNSFRLASIIRHQGVTLVHARSRAPAWSAWLASLLTGVAYVTTFHGTYSLKGGWLKRIYNSVMLRGPVVIANSEFIRSHILENYDMAPADIIVAPRGIEPSRWDPSAFTKKDRENLRQEWNVKNGTPVILIVGRITRWKGHDLLIEALGELMDIDWVLVVAGDIEKESEYGKSLKNRASELGIASRIRWLGSRRDIAHLLYASELAVSASTKPEAFGRVAVEAMAMGVPVVATGIGGSLETVLDGKTGFLVKPGAMEEKPKTKSKSSNQSGQLFGEFRSHTMALKLREALQSPAKLHSMGQAARAHVLSTYTVEKCCAAEESAYHRILATTETEQVA